ncbi:MAG: hypothetical protein COT84_07540 [Chlamydiae bacterium CG10_big_fil_rev_8_21_14_0_10_35_9]|nr:MAG: hypothetical protein COT84_07540 [Chlamydiae bacterium CG10_big_fil_rev_8_21_14_0_10_35_9]
MIELICKIPIWLWVFIILILGIIFIFFILFQFILHTAQRESGEQNIEKALYFFMKKHGNEKNIFKTKKVMEELNE